MDIRRQVEQLILNYGGVVFGGYVRDLVRFDTGDTRVKFGDIDCYMVSHAVNAFTAHLRTHHMRVDVVFDRPDATRYMARLDVPADVIRHTRLKVSVLDKPIAQHVGRLVRRELNANVHDLVQRQIDEFVAHLERMSNVCEPLFIDLFVAECHDYFEYSPPFGSVDFECNGLILSRNGIGLAESLYPALLPMERHAKFQEILRDISNKVAVYTDLNIRAARVEKMRNKGWRVDPKLIIVRDAPPAENDVCILCHDAIESHHYKLPCCSALYHRKCMIQLLSSDFKGGCVMCKRSTLAWRELSIIQE